MRVLVEVLHVLIGLVVAAALTIAAAWAYPLGREVIWWCGGVAMVATVLFGVEPVRRAWHRDRSADRGRDRERA